VTLEHMYPEVKGKAGREQRAFQQFSPAEIA